MNMPIMKSGELSTEIYFIFGLGKSPFHRDSCRTGVDSCGGEGGNNLFHFPLLQS